MNLSVDRFDHTIIIEVHDKVKTSMQFSHKDIAIKD